MKAFSETNIGKKRSMNQDYVFTSTKPVGNLPNLFVVADGMGGHSAGEKASALGVNVLVNEIKKDKDLEPIKIIRHGIECANFEIIKEANGNEKLYGMGTTMVVATIVNNVLHVGNVGDSRLYVINNTIKQITRDHSLVQEMVRLGEISKEEAKKHPDKNKITRALGAEKSVIVDFFDVKLEDGTTILMCSDGLTNMVDDIEIEDIINLDSIELEEKGIRLIELANNNGGLDNIAIILIEPYKNEVKKC